MKGLLLFAAIVAGTGIFSSCDDSLDQRLAEIEKGETPSGTQTKTELQRLDGVTKDLEKDINDNAAKCSTEWARLDSLLKELRKDVNKEDSALRDSIAAHLVRIAELERNYTSLKKQSDDNKKLIEALQKADTTLKEYVDSLAGIATAETEALRRYVTDTLKTSVDSGVQAAVWMEKVKGDVARINQIVDSVKNLYAADVLLNQRVDSLQDSISDINSKLASLDAKLGNHITDYNTKMQTVTNDISNLKDSVSSINQTLLSLDQRVKENKDSIDALAKKFDNLTKRVDVIENQLKKLITSIIVQAVHNPVFGYINLPTNTNTNILLGNYGVASNTYSFPPINTTTGEAVFGQPYINKAAANLLALSGDIKSYAMQEGDNLYNGDGGIDLGTLFVTVNPTAVEFDGVKFDLVNSQDENSGVILSDLIASDEVISFGFGRGRANNGFYETNAIVPNNQIENLKLAIDAELKSAAKDAFNNRTKQDFVQLLAQVVKQLTNNLPAYGLKAAWTVDDIYGNPVQNATYSNYNLAAAVYRPLSFKFLSGKNFKDLPVISPITGFEFDMDKFTFDIDMPELTVDGVDLDLKLSEVKLDLGNNQLVITMNHVINYGGYLQWFGPIDTDAVVDFTDFGNKIAEELNKNVDVWNDEIQVAFDKAIEKLVADINQQLKDAMDDVAGNIEDQIKDVLGDIFDEVNGKLEPALDYANKMIDIYNRVVNRLNGILDDPNHYLQVMMVYKAADGDFHQMSNSKSIPTVFYSNGSGNAISLYTTTYSAEIVAPSFKKFIGVTDVFDENGNSAQGRNSDCIAALKAANDREFMGEVVDGNTIRVALEAKAGYTYEITYSALDYDGYTSTNKYYVKVK